MILAKKQFAFLALFISLFLILFSVLILDSVLADEKLETKVNTVSLISESINSSSLFLLSNSSEQNEKEIILPEVIADYDFNIFGLKWQAKNSNFTIYVKTDKSDWITVNELIATKPREDGFHFSEPIVISGKSITTKIVFQDAQADLNNLPDLELIYLDSRPVSIFSPQRALASVYHSISKTDGVKIISRTEWGANEDYRTWEPQYDAPQAFVIHHTAGGDGADDPAATVRGIYYWHAVVLGWGDIGYNYLVDPEGNIYEGRYGGDGAIGAHAYNNVTDVNYNDGTIGISVLGCYEDETNDCYIVNQYNDNIQNAVTSLIAEKANDLNISLNGERTVIDKSVPSIVGHRDLDYTLCPGNILETQLPGMITVAEEKYQALVVNQQYRATLNNQNYASAYFINATINPVVSYKNSGDLPWLSSEVKLKVRDSAAKKTYYYNLDRDVQPGESYDFNYTWTTPAKAVNERITLKLFRNDEYVAHSRKYLDMRIDNPNQATLIKQNIPVAVLSSWNPVITVKYKNSGIVPWNKEQTKLLINGQEIATLNTADVQPGSTGIYTFSLNKIANLAIGKNKLVIKLKQDGVVVQGSRLVWTLRIDQ